MTEDGKIDEAGFKAAKAKTTVRRFTPDEDAQEGMLNKKGDRWFFDYGDATDADEPLYRVGEHKFAVGEYVTITDEDGRLLTYKVTDVTRSSPPGVTFRSISRSTSWLWLS